MRMLVFLAVVLPVLAQDPAEIVRKSLDREIDHQRKLANYTWETVSVERELEKNGKVKKTEVKVHENLNIDGTSYRRLIEENGKPLSAEKARKEQEKMDKEIAKRKNETESQRKKRLNDERKEREEAIKFRREVMDAFDFKLEGEEKVNGLLCWRIAGERKPGFKSKTREGSWLAKMHGKIWVEKQTSEWMRFEVETLEKIRMLGFVATLNPGAVIQVQQMRVNDELWHPQNAKIKINARALWKSFNGDGDVSWRNFRKFQTESTLVAAEEIK